MLRFIGGVFWMLRFIGGVFWMLRFIGGVFAVSGWMLTALTCLASLSRLVLPAPTICLSAGVNSLRSSLVNYLVGVGPFVACLTYLLE